MASRAARKILPLWGVRISRNVELPPWQLLLVSLLLPVFLSFLSRFMARFQPGNKEATKARGKTKRPVIAHMLEEYAPNVTAVVKEMLASSDLQVRWICAREILPYLWPKRAAVATTADGKPAPTLEDYLAKAPSPPPAPSVSVPKEESLQ